MKILYIGNDLSKDTQYHNAFRTLKQNLTKEGFEVIGVSSKKNKVLRFMDMVFSVFVNARKVSYVIIDVFSTSAFYFEGVKSERVEENTKTTRVTGKTDFTTTTTRTGTDNSTVHVAGL